MRLIYFRVSSFWRVTRVADYIFSLKHTNLYSWMCRKFHFVLLEIRFLCGRVKLETLKVGFLRGKRATFIYPIVIDIVKSGGWFSQALLSALLSEKL